MTATKLHYAVAVAVAAALLASLALAGCKKDAEDTAVVPPPAASEPSTLPPAEPMPMPTDTAPMGSETMGTQTALNVTAVTLGTEAGDDKKLAAAMTTFAPADPIIVSVATDGAASNAEIAAKLIYQDGQTAGEESETVTTTGMETTNITFTNANPWPTGDYTAEVWINGTQAETTAFNVR